MSTLYHGTPRAARVLLVMLVWPLLFLTDQAVAEVDLTDYQDDARVTFSFEGFSLHYPATWSLAQVTPPMVLYVEDRARLPAMRVMVLDEPFWLPLNFATRAASTALADLGRDIELKGERVEDWNGLRVNVGEVHWTMNMGLGLPLRSLFVSTFSHGKWILVNLLTGPGDDPFPAALMEIARSLQRQKQAQSRSGPLSEDPFG